MVMVAERILNIVDVVHYELSLGLQQVAAFVETIEKSNPGDADLSVPMEFHSIYHSAQLILDNLIACELPHPSIQRATIEYQTLLDSYGERFMSWTDGQDEQSVTISVSEAMDKYERSRSTIYRWIRSGRLHATKQGRLWRIAV